MWNLSVLYHNGTSTDFLCSCFSEGMNKLRELRGYKKYRMHKLQA